ncbi:MAG: apolipoprotein N-acyltransferase [Nocardioidaceae bacterium]
MTPRLIGLAKSTVSVLAGLAVAASFPPWGHVELLPIGLAGLMLTTRRSTGRTGFLQGLLFGLGFMLPLMRWITIIGPDAWVALGLLEALFYGGMGMTWAWLRSSRWWPLAIAATWVGAELLRSTIPWGGMPWGRLAFGLVETPLVGYGRIGGSALVAALTVAAVAFFVNVVEHVAWRRSPSQPVASENPGAEPERRLLDKPAVLSAAVAWGLVLLSPLLPTGPASSGDRVTVAAIQGNVPGEGMNAFAERRAVLTNHAQTTHDYAEQVRRGAQPAPDLVIWPENSTDIDPYADRSAYTEIDQAVRDIQAPTLVGAVVSSSDATRVQNMGIVWDPSSGPGEQYVKRHPVPFGEYIPMRGLLTPFISRLEQIPRDMARGTFDSVLDLGEVRVGDVICFEVAYDGLIRDAVLDGGELLVVQTNNATYTGTGQLQQQFAISRYRAIETGRTVVVAATNGISGIIGPDGTVLDSAGEKTRAVLVEEVTLANGITLGVRIGGWLELGLALIALAWAGAAYFARRRSVGTMAT